MVRYAAAFLFGGNPRIKKRQDGETPVGGKPAPTGDIKKRQDRRSNTPYDLI